MAKGMYIGVGNKARKVKKIYFGVSGKARKVKKAWLGVGGKARLIFSGGELSYYGTATALSVARSQVTATTVGNYALFGGGLQTSSSGGNTHSSIVNAYNASLTRSTPKALSVARYQLAATTVGNYALFAGGNQSGNTNCITVDAYNTSLTRSTPTALSAGTYELAATTVGNYALFGGGQYWNSRYELTDSARVDAYNASLTRSIPTALSVARYQLAAAAVGNYALFIGGTRHTSSSTAIAVTTVDAYNASLTRSTPTELSSVGSGMAGTTVGNYALFGGGSTTVNAYNASLTRSNPKALSVSRTNLAATTVGEYALFGGGYGLVGTSYQPIATVDAYNASLTRSIPTALSAGRNHIAAATIGDYALFAGGAGSSNTDTVDVYQVG